MRAVGKTALRDVRVFDGRGLTEPCTVVIDGGMIGVDGTGAEVVDAAGGVVLPGLIDAHIHPDGRAALAALSAYGVTTGLAMATWPVELVASLRDAPGLTDIRSAGLPAIGPGGVHARMPGLAEHAVGIRYTRGGSSPSGSPRASTTSRSCSRRPARVACRRTWPVRWSPRRGRTG